MDTQAVREEQELLERIRGGDGAAFRELYAIYRPRLFSFLVRLTGRREIAEELAQEVWLRLAARPPEPRPEVSAGAWLFRVARNLYLSHLRNRDRDPGRTAELTAMDCRPAGGADPLSALAGQETLRQLEQGLARLPLPHRESLLLVAVAGLQPAQAAQALGIRPEAFRQRLSRARKSLWALLARPPAREVTR